MFFDKKNILEIIFNYDIKEIPYIIKDIRIPQFAKIATLFPDCWIFKKG